MTIGQRIKSLRMDRSLSQEYVAISLGVSRQAVSKWETDAAVPDTYNLIALAKLFEVSVESIVSVADEDSAETVAESEATPEKRKNVGLLACSVSVLIGLALITICYLGEQISNRFLTVDQMLLLLPMLLSAFWMLFYRPESLAYDKRGLRRAYIRSLIYALIIEAVCALLFVGYYLEVYTYRLMEYMYYYIWPLVVLQVNMMVLLNLSLLIPILTNRRFGQPLRIALYILSTLLCILCVAIFANLISAMNLWTRILLMLLGTVISGGCLVLSCVNVCLRIKNADISEQ